MARRRSGRAPDTSAATLAAPVGGLNDRDPIANMPITDAVILENWWPQPGKLSARAGSIKHVIGIPGEIQTLVEYDPPSGDTKLLASSAGSIYDVTHSSVSLAAMFASDAIADQFAADDDSPTMFAGFLATPLYTGATNDAWQVAKTTTAGGSFQLWMNGTDKIVLFDGTDWTPIDATSTPAITGVDTDSIIDGVVFKNRIYLVERDSLNLWYLPVTSIAGAAEKIAMGQIFRHGGHIVTAQTWTIDAGEGSDDMLVVLSSNGEAVVFAGYDPSDADNWRVVGVFLLGRPIGQRPCIKFGGDLLVICEDGVFPLSKALVSASTDKRVALTDKIQNSIRAAVTAERDTFGWQLCQSPSVAALILNVPQFDGTYLQYVQNTLTGAWTRFTGWNALCWVDSRLGLYFGDSEGNIYRAWQTNQDDGENIVADALQAFSVFGSNAITKFFTMARPYLETSGSPDISYVFCGDYVIDEPHDETTYSGAQTMKWGTMIWGENMQWSGKKTQIYNWRTVGKTGKAGALRIRMQNNGAQTDWIATDVMMTRGWYL